MDQRVFGGPPVPPVQGIEQQQAAPVFGQERRVVVLDDGVIAAVLDLLEMVINVEVGRLFHLRQQLFFVTIGSE